MKNKQLVLCVAALTLVIALAGIDYGIFRRLYVPRAQMKSAVQAAYKAGMDKGMHIAIDGSTEARALAMLFKRYRLDDQTAKQYAVWTIESAIKYRIPSLLLAGLIMQESSCRYDAVSATGAIGLTQVDWRWWGEFLQARGIAQKRAELFNPRISIEAGAAILAHLIDRYGSIERALEHYSGGARQYVSKICKRATAW